MISRIILSPAASIIIPTVALFYTVSKISVNDDKGWLQKEEEADEEKQTEEEKKEEEG